MMPRLEGMMLVELPARAATIFLNPPATAPPTKPPEAKRLLTPLIQKLNAES
jgi:hypothetical protein